MDQPTQELHLGTASLAQGSVRVREIRERSHHPRRSKRFCFSSVGHHPVGVRLDLASDRGPPQQGDHRPGDGSAAKAMRAPERSARSLPRKRDRASGSTADNRRRGKWNAAVTVGVTWHCPSIPAAAPVRAIVGHTAGMMVLTTGLVVVGAAVPLPRSASRSRIASGPALAHLLHGGEHVGGAHRSVRRG